jgi:hypothetical protein
MPVSYSEKAISCLENAFSNLENAFSYSETGDSCLEIGDSCSEIAISCLENGLSCLERRISCSENSISLPEIAVSCLEIAVSLSGKSVFEPVLCEATQSETHCQKFVLFFISYSSQSPENRINDLVATDYFCLLTFFPHDGSLVPFANR